MTQIYQYKRSSSGFTASCIILLVAFMAAGTVQSQSLHTNNPVYRAVFDKDGISTLPFAFNPSQVPERTRWQGQWIWLNKNAFADYQRTNTTWINPTGITPKNYQALFRKTFDVKTNTGKGLLYITADVHFAVYINGKMAARGPVNIGSDYGDTVSPSYWYYQVFDVKPFLKKGLNSIAVRVFSTSFEISATTSSYGRILCDLVIDDQPVSVSSDNSWRCNVEILYSKRSLLTYDANKETAGWTMPVFDDSRWTNADVVAVVTPELLFPSKIPVPVDIPVDPVNYNRITGGRAASIQQADFFTVPAGYHEYLLDFGKNISARIAFDLEAGNSDSIKIYPHEKLEHGSNHEWMYICRQGQNSYETPHLAAFRYLKISVHAQKPISIRRFHANFSSYPVQYAGSFECDVPFYNRLWNIIRWSTQLCMNDMMYDSPNHQEPIGCTGDYYIESLTNYYAFADAWLIRQNIVQTAQMMAKNDYRMFHTSYSLLWVQMLRSYFEHTGDTTLVHELLPYVKKLLGRFKGYLNNDHIVSNAPNYMFMDWVRIDEFNAHHPPASIGMGFLSMMYYQALKDAAALCSVAADTVYENNLHNLSQKVKDGINALLWDKEKKLYKDGIPFITSVKPGDWLPADKNIVTYSPHINTLAVLYDIAPADVQDTLLKYVVTQTRYELQPYFMFYVLNAFQRAGKIDEGLAQIDRWKDGIDTGTFTLKENWNVSSAVGYGGDWSHAWGGAPLRFLSHNILGIGPAAPGFSNVRITPYTGNKIRWAKGSVAAGENKIINIQWNKESEGTITYTISIPEQQGAEIRLPQKYSACEALVNGKKTIYNKDFRLGSGAYTLVFR
ncbi:MAG: alpha-L-rhamnosidase N-terminal domain-containing protein [Chitinophagaceae bacterium]|nr:alpha-L-rhamnosidase N-terminal domain-containing protein [Chitinophagaceae bacterium]